VEARGATQRGHQIPERDRGEKSMERMKRLFSLLERMLNKYIISHSILAKRKQWEKMGTLHFFNIFFFKCLIVSETTEFV